MRKPEPSTPSGPPPLPGRQKQTGNGVPAWTPRGRAMP